jgi:flagellar protein FlaG
MVSEIQNLNTAGAGRSPVAPTVAPAAQAAHVAPTQPRVSLPKPAEIRYDEAKSRQSLHEAVGLLNEQMKAGNQGLSFAVDPSSERPVVTVRNTETGEVVRQIPNEVVIRIGRSIDELKGLLHNAKV